MAGRYLLIEFDDDTAASLLREQINRAAKAGKKFRVVGLFARPGKTCGCAYIPGERSADRVARGAKLGWWVCSTCKRPRHGNHQLKNLITPPEVVEPRTFEGVDTLHFPMDERQYIFHPEGISLNLLPERVASPDAS